MKAIQNLYNKLNALTNGNTTLMVLIFIVYVVACGGVSALGLIVLTAIIGWQNFIAVANIYVPIMALLILGSWIAFIVIGQSNKKW